MAIPEDNTDLRGSSTLPGQLADMVNDLFGSGLEPGRGGTRVGDSRGRNALSLAVKTTHFEIVCFVDGEVLKESRWGCRGKESKGGREFREVFRCVECGSRAGGLRLKTRLRRGGLSWAEFSLCNQAVEDWPRALMMSFILRISVAGCR